MGIVSAQSSYERLLTAGFAVLSYIIVAACFWWWVPGRRLPFLLASGTIIAAEAIVLCKARDRTIPMVVALGLISTFYFVIVPFEMPPDEPAHFYRAFGISMGRLFAIRLSSGEFGDMLPRAIIEGWRTEPVVDYAQTAEAAFPNTAMYSFVCYIPQALGIALSRLITKRVVVIYYTGRLINFLAALALSAAALRRIPFGKMILLVVMLFPATLQEMVSMAPDALLNALSFFYAAYILDCAHTKEKVSKADVAVIGISLAVISLTKIAYLGAFFLVYMIPAKKLGGRSVLVLRVALPLLAAALNLLQLAVASRILVNTDYGFPTGTGFRATESVEQAKFILRHPFFFGGVLVRTAVERGAGYVGMCVGVLLSWVGSPREISVPIVLCLPFLLACLYFCICGDCMHKPGAKDVLPLMLCFFSACVLILASEYVAWTPLYATVIEGVNGKYFLPVVPCLLLALSHIFRLCCIRGGGWQFANSAYRASCSRLWC